MSERPGSDTEAQRETVFVEDAPRRIFGNLLIDGPDGQCAYIYAGIEQRCQNEAVAHTWLDHGNSRKLVEMCAEHAREDVPEPPSSEQQKLVTDGGTDGVRPGSVASRLEESPRCARTFIDVSLALEHDCLVGAIDTTMGKT